MQSSFHSEVIVIHQALKIRKTGFRLQHALINNLPIRSFPDRNPSYNLRKGSLRAAGLLLGRSIAVPLERPPTF